MITVGPVAAFEDDFDTRFVITPKPEAMARIPERQRLYAIYAAAKEQHKEARAALRVLPNAANRAAYREAWETAYRTWRAWYDCATLADVEEHG